MGIFILSLFPNLLLCRFNASQGLKRYNHFSLISLKYIKENQKEIHLIKIENSRALPQRLQGACS